MRAMATALGLVIVVGAGYLIYQATLTNRGRPATPPAQQIDLVGVQSDLLSMAQAERQHLATRGAYGTLDQLQQDGLLTGGVERRGYTYTATVEGATAFTIVATPSAADKGDWPVMSIDQTMQVTRK